MRFYLLTIFVVLLGCVPVLSAEPTLSSASDSLNNLVVLPAMLYMYRKLLSNEQLLIRQQKQIIRLLRWKKMTLSSPCSILPLEQD